MSDTEQLPAWCPGDGWCSITATASLVGKKWHPVIIHRLLTRGPLGFNALQEEVDGISSKVLSESLDDLEEKQVVSRTIVSEKPVRVEYALTELGESLEPVVTALENWGNEHLEPVDEEAASLV
ncbi:helix-turn-helix transcriptional regulator [Halobacterium sp. KA-4]|jgi:DNA-binding HxlR family transcriptional regulator|uniref:winged helix-turn-helix transcriptional regulator n=1 Tax=Halobacterium sp. KA-4 TaxID=2896367 RepID=UPI001E53844A|nr:helix-turn-helix domain-containing protein [Halobacterium sp. KA-4]MCD2199207.1 helix-turn-helix transcriptional regulator [Halobacterium sp. KA-4]